ncbi:MAG: RraA family protein [Clostridia bacterium]|nr:RraA family protein [Clostridia bacterium]
MIELNNDKQIFAMMREYLYTAVVGDIMDTMGYEHQFLPPQIRPLRDDMVVVGRAMTVTECDANTPEAKAMPKFGKMFEALDNLKEDEVYICSGCSPTYAVLGELMSMRAKYLKSSGAVLNGYLRDTHGILKLDYPVFTYGCYAQDQGPRGVVTDYRKPLQVGDVLVNPGDIVFGDIDGVVIIPKTIEKEVLTKAYEKAVGEKTVANLLKNGVSSYDAFKQYGIF